MGRYDLDCQLHPVSMDTEDGGGTCMRSMLKWDLHAETIQLTVKDDIHNDSFLVLWKMLYLFCHVCRAALGNGWTEPKRQPGRQLLLWRYPEQLLPAGHEELPQLNCLNLRAPDRGRGNTPSRVWEMGKKPQLPLNWSLIPHLAIRGKKDMWFRFTSPICFSVLEKESIAKVFHNS